ncbi:unnamed protein product [Protopolystoma xenopodis]|uniref:Uncharacterized protein n=1 Tax=Protopolystoma xenopodis TaxID=117903 RepID=A0A448X0F2_9PLAT|nr:unnamed protein product [Protopolystoma xenopodis]
MPGRPNDLRLPKQHKKLSGPLVKACCGIRYCVLSSSQVTYGSSQFAISDQQAPIELVIPELTHQLVLAGFRPTQVLKKDEL